MSARPTVDKSARHRGAINKPTGSRAKFIASLTDGQSGVHFRSDLSSNAAVSDLFPAAMALKHLTFRRCQQHGVVRFSSGYKSGYDRRHKSAL
jgi:hypothetical protein